MSSKKTKPLKGYNGKYLIREDGVVYRVTDQGTLKRCAESQGRVRLYSNGTVYRPLVETLLNDYFGANR